MEKNERHKIEEMNRLVTIAIGCVNTLERSVSALMNSFQDRTDYLDAKVTLRRLHTECLLLDADVKNVLDLDGKEVENGH